MVYIALRQVYTSLASQTLLLCSALSYLLMRAVKGRKKERRARGKGSGVNRQVFRIHWNVVAVKRAT